MKQPNTNKITWRSPSNIALIKYWGKKGLQIPANPSLSFSLKNSYSETSIYFTPGKGEKPVIDFYFNNSPQQEFGKKVKAFLNSITDHFQYLNDFDLRIESANSFPHSTGIASSASAMSSLALCICSLDRELNGNLQDDDEFYRKASYIARLGSGSASRSVYGGFVTWGKSYLIDDSSDLYASPLPFQIHPTFSELKDSILIVSSEKKKISSSTGHQYMQEHPYAKARYNEANNNFAILLNAIKTGNIDTFIDITEREALSLHALFMSSDPAYLLMHPNSINIINKIIDFRNQSGAKICFTLDAGPNIHLIYPKSIKEQIRLFIIEELLVYCEQNKWIDDCAGSGPEQLKDIT